MQELGPSATHAQPGYVVHISIEQAARTTFSKHTGSSNRAPNDAALCDHRDRKAHDPL